MPYFAEAILIDAGAAIALTDKKDQFHVIAKKFFDNTSDILWVSLNATAQESYTRARYDLGFPKAIGLYDFLRGEPLYHIRFESEDEEEASRLLKRYADHIISFHDALCAAVMKRVGIYRAFTFDHHFYNFGFEVLPGTTRQRRS